MAKKKPATKKKSARATSRSKTGKSPASKSSARKKVAKKTPAKKAAVKKPVKSKKAAAKKAPAKKSAKKKVAKKKATTKKRPVKKSASKKTTAKKTAATKSTKKAPAKKTAKKQTAKSSVKKSKPAAAPAAPAEVHDQNQPLSEAQRRKVKTGLTKKDLKMFREELLERRKEIIEDLQGMTSAQKDANSDASHMPLHMADVGSDNFEREMNLGFMQNEQRLLGEIDAALQRIDDGTYGVCEISGKPIIKPRLEYIPWARYSLEVARQRERQGW